MRAEELQRFAQELHDRVARRCEEQCDRLRWQQAQLLQRALVRDRRRFVPWFGVVGDNSARRHRLPSADAP